jgi:hypothetical protein
MKISHLLNSVSIIVTNEEKKFIDRYGKKISLLSLSEQDQWMAQNLVRKGVYTISKDKGYIVKQKNDERANPKYLD